MVKPRLLRFSRSKLRQWLDANEMDAGDMMRQMVKEGPDDLQPSSTYIQNVLSGQTKRPSADYVFLFAFVLGCSIDELGEPYDN